MLSEVSRARRCFRLNALWVLARAGFLSAPSANCHSTIIRRLLRVCHKATEELTAAGYKAAPLRGMRQQRSAAGGECAVRDSGLRTAGIRDGDTTAAGPGAPPPPRDQECAAPLPGYL